MRMRTSHVRLLLTACLLTTGAVAFPQGAAVALANPEADFDWTPKPVVAGAPVTLVSTSIPDEDTPLSAITDVEWDLDGQAICDGLTLSGATCTTTAPAAGDWEVRVTVTDIFLDSDSEKKRIVVEAPAAPIEPGAGTAPPPTSNGTGRPRLLTPFPVVTVGGHGHGGRHQHRSAHGSGTARCTRAGPLPRRGVPADACFAGGAARSSCD